MDEFGSFNKEYKITKAKPITPTEPPAALPPPSFTPEHTPFYKKNVFWYIVILILFLIILIQHWPFKKKIQPSPLVPVVTAVAQNADIPVYLSELGTVTPVYTVTVRTQINGQLLQVLYKEGQMVKKGDLLAEIDPRPYQALLIQYQGQLARDQALLDNARIDLKRYLVLWKQNSIAEQTLATQQSLVKQYEGAVKIDEGLIQATKVNLIYTNITSPVDGRVGLRLVDPGNFVQTSDTTGIAVIATLHPITVIFSIPEDNIPDVLHQIEGGQTLAVKAYDRQQNQLLSVGKLLTIDNQIDPTTGTVKLRAEFENQENRLFPNQFVNIGLLVKTLKDVTIVPTSAIQNGAPGTFVFIVNKNQFVNIQSVKTGVTYGNYTVIRAGLSPGQIVVTQGGDKLQEGTRVSISKSTNTS